MIGTIQVYIHPTMLGIESIQSLYYNYDLGCLFLGLELSNSMSINVHVLYPLVIKAQL